MSRVLIYSDAALCSNIVTLVRSCCIDKPAILLSNCKQVEITQPKLHEKHISGDLVVAATPNILIVQELV